MKCVTTTILASDEVDSSLLKNARLSSFNWQSESDESGWFSEVDISGCCLVPRNLTEG